MSSKRCCFVASCKNTSATSNKTFVYVPKAKDLRQRWFNAVGRECTSTSHISCCEDHFDAEKDFANLTHYKLMKGRIILRGGVVPHLRLDDASEDEDKCKKRRFETSKNDLNVCRTCLSPFADMKSLYELCSGSPKICFAEMLSSLTPLKCFRNDGLPTRICCNCMEELSRFNAFQLKCLESDRQLRHDIQRQQLKTDQRLIFADMLPIHPDNRSDCTYHAPHETKEKLPSSPLNDFVKHEIELKTELEDDRVTFNEINIETSHPKTSVKDPLEIIEEDPYQEISVDHIKIEIDDLHQLNMRNISENNNKCVQLKQFPCKHCNNVFKTKSYLNIHLRTHNNGEKAYSCTLCDCSFVDNSTFIVHMRQHDREKPFACAVCVISFNNAESLSAHMRKHKVRSIRLVS